MAILKYLFEALKEEQRSAEQIFDSIDYLENELVSVVTLADEIQSVLETWIYKSHYMKLVKSLDIDGDGTISRKDFTKLVMLAGKSKVSTEQFYASDVYKN